MLVEGLACVFHGERVAEVLAWARGARVRVGVPPSCALRTGFDRLRANGGGERGCGGVAGGCFGNGFIAGLAQFSYKSKNLLAERKQPPLMLAEPPLTIDADYATNDQTGAPDGVGTRAVLVAVSDCVFHGGRVTGELAWALGARVRVVGEPPSCALRTGFDRLRANGFGERGCGGIAGVGGCEGVGGGDAPPGAPGYRLSPVRRWVCTGWQVLLVAEA